MRNFYREHLYLHLTWIFITSKTAILLSNNGSLIRIQRGFGDSASLSAGPWWHAKECHDCSRNYFEKTANIFWSLHSPIFLNLFCLKSSCDIYCWRRRLFRVPTKERANQVIVSREVVHPARFFWIPPY